MSASLLVSCVGVATRPGFRPIAKETAEAAPTLCTEYGLMDVSRTNHSLVGTLCFLNGSPDIIISYYLLHFVTFHPGLVAQPEKLFQTFDSKPLGAASLAQVHRAVLKDGRTVAVKVQHRQVQQQAIRDLQLMEVLVHTVAWLFPEFHFLWLLNEARKNLPVELDFMNEGRNAEKISGMLQHFGFLKIQDGFETHNRRSN
uniref:AarF domain-containing protein kinase 1 n=1 Tax=Eptatretus burgeri TaxID=7764 RepID=A0A8C4QUM0_EPTBU